MKETMMTTTTLSVYIETLAGFSFLTDTLDVHPVAEAMVFRNLRSPGTYRMMLTLPKNGGPGDGEDSSVFEADFTSGRGIRRIFATLLAAGCRDAPAAIACIVGWADTATAPSAMTASSLGYRYGSEPLKLGSDLETRYGRMLWFLKSLRTKGPEQPDELNDSNDERLLDVGNEQSAVAGLLRASI